MTSPTKLSSMLRHYHGDGQPSRSMREDLGRREPETRDELRNAWLTVLMEHAYSVARPPLTAREFFRGKPVLRLTEKTEALDLFPRVSTPHLQAAARAMWREGGWLCLWSSQYGTGKTTYALYHILRWLRKLAEERADAGLRCSPSGSDDAPLPTIEFTSWRRSLGLIKVQASQRIPARDTVSYRLRKADYVVIDDVVQGSNYEAGLLEDLLADRAQARLRTILCSGGHPRVEHLEEVLGPRVLNFLSGCGTAVEVGINGGSYRRREPEASVIQTVPAF